MSPLKNVCLVSVVVFGALMTFYGSVGALFVVEPKHAEYSEFLFSIVFFGLTSAVVALKYFRKINANNRRT